MLGDVGAFPDKDVLTFSINSDSIVGHEPVAALDQVECNFTFADSALPYEQKANAVDVNKRAVNYRARREYLIQKLTEEVDQPRRLECAPEDRDAVLGDEIDEVLLELVAVRDDDTRYLELQDSL